MHENIITIVECGAGYYGENCSTECSCQEHTSCDSRTGACDGACIAGYTGDNCNISENCNSVNLSMFLSCSYLLFIMFAIIKYCSTYVFAIIIQCNRNCCFRLVSFSEV